MEEEDIKAERNEKGQYLPGKSGNPLGRPKRGWSIRDKFWQRFENKPEELESFMNELLKDHKHLVWQMLEGRPAQDMNLGSNAELPFKIIIEKTNGGTAGTAGTTGTTGGEGTQG